MVGIWTGYRKIHITCLISIGIRLIIDNNIRCTRTSKQTSRASFDKLWNGQSKSITGLTSKFLFFPFQISDNEPFENQKIPKEVYLDAYSLSENMFLYEKSYLTQQYNKVDPFAEPSNVFSNIKNGYGIFAGYQRKRVRIF